MLNEQAQRNEEAAKSVETSFPDWAVTMCFYAALHWVESYAKKKGDDIERYDGSTRHQRRRKYIADLAYSLGNRRLRIAYEDLETESRRARYLEGLDTSAIAYYKSHTPKVRDSFQKLQSIKQLLSH
jgi:hypothetical protein